MSSAMNCLVFAFYLDAENENVGNVVLEGNQNLKKVKKKLTDIGFFTAGFSGHGNDLLDGKLDIWMVWTSLAINQLLAQK